jgi:hypothetical protein
MMKTFIAVALCLCLLLAPVAHAQSAALVDSIIKGCQGSSGLNGILCKGAVSLGEQFCKSPGGGSNCVKFVTDLCRVSVGLQLLQPCRKKVPCQASHFMEALGWWPSWCIYST